MFQCPVANVVEIIAEVVMLTRTVPSLQTNGSSFSPHNDLIGIFSVFFLRLHFFILLPSVFLPCEHANRTTNASWFI